MKQQSDKKTVDMEDIFIWPCGTWCYRFEYEEMSHLSDDHVIYFLGTPEWNNHPANKAWGS